MGRSILWARMEYSLGPAEFADANCKDQVPFHCAAALAIREIPLLQIVHLLRSPHEGNILIDLNIPSE